MTEVRSGKRAQGFVVEGHKEARPMRASILGKVLTAAAVASVLLVTLGVGVAWALTIDCTINPVALCEGSNARDEFEGEDVDDGVDGRRDVIEGKRSSDSADGNGGNDRILGGGGPDGELGGRLWGGAGDDYVDGGPGDDDNVKGGSGDDTVNGGPGSDGDGSTVDGDLEGGAGNNKVRGGPGDDLIDANDSLAGEVEDVSGGADDDTIRADDGQVDNIDCGTGNDTVAVDVGIDTLASC